MTKNIFIIMMSSEVIIVPRTRSLVLRHDAQDAVGASHLKQIFVEPAGLSLFGQSYLKSNYIFRSTVTVN